MSNTVEGLVVTASPGWQEFPAGYIDFVDQASTGAIAVTAAEATAIQKTEQQVKLAPGADLSDPRTMDMYEEMKAHVATVRFIAEYWTTFDPTRKIAVLPDGAELTGSQLSFRMDKIEFMVTNEAVLNGAATFTHNLLPGGSAAYATFTIKINPNDPTVISYVDNPALGAQYVVAHEIGHATPEHIDFAVKYANLLKSPNVPLIQSAAQSWGRALSPSGTFPTDAELQAAGQDLPLPAPAPTSPPTAGNDMLTGFMGDYTILGGGWCRHGYIRQLDAVRDSRPPITYDLCSKRRPPVPRDRERHWLSGR